jgi:hypothetical protein
MAGKKKGKAGKQSKQAKTPSKKKLSVSPVAKAQPAAEAQLPNEAQPPDTPEPTGETLEPAESQIDVELEEARAAEVRANFDYRRKQKAEWRRWRKLANNKDFVWETWRLKFQLLESLGNDPDQIRKFFRPSLMVTPTNLGAVNRQILDVRDETLKALLIRCVKYVLRYQLVLSLAKAPPYFRIRGLGFWGNKFQVAIRDGQLEPIGGIPPWEEEGARRLRISLKKQGTGSLPNRIKPGDVLVTGTPLSDGFESDELPVPAGLQSLVKEGWAKYVWIEDKDEFSMLRQITDFAYSPDQVTVIDYSSTFPHKFYLVGENVPLNKVWPKLRRVAADSQRQTGKGDQRGRSPKLRRLYAELNLIVRGKGSMENRAQILRRMEDREREEKRKPPKPQTDARVAAKQSYLSQLKKQLKD